MGNVPARCRACGHPFFAPIKISNSLDITLSGVTATCPSCGGRAEVIEGTFDVAGEGRSAVFRQTAGEPIDPELFTRLGLILVQAEIDNLKPHEIVEKIGSHSTVLASRLRRVMDDPKAFAAVISALIVTLGAVAVAAINNSAESSPPPDINIHQEFNLERTRDSLYEMRETGKPVPLWAADYI